MRGGWGRENKRENGKENEQDLVFVLFACFLLIDGVFTLCYPPWITKTKRKGKGNTRGYGWKLRLFVPVWICVLLRREVTTNGKRKKDKQPVG